MVCLLVAEKPSVGRDLARVLGVRDRQTPGVLKGPTLWITWCVGHLAELCEPAHYDAGWRAWRLEVLPMLPKRFAVQPRRSSLDQYEVVRAALRHRQVKTVINACDAGREGELIFAYVYELAGCRKPVQRLWLAALTDAAIHRAMEQLKPAAHYQNLAAAARCRAEADWLVGLNATRALTLKAGRQALHSVGRVQTPTLSLLCAREDEIDAFEAQPYWRVTGHFLAPQGDAAPLPYRGVYTVDNSDRCTAKEAAQAVCRAVAGQAACVTAVQERLQRLQAPSFFDLTAAQRVANRRFHLSASATLEALQALYERHKLITYPRTDACVLASDMRPEARRILRSLENFPAVGGHVATLSPDDASWPARLFDDAAMGDHHAIVPTGKAPPGSLSAVEAKVYDMVLRRFVAAFMPEVQMALGTLETTVRASSQAHRFVSRGRVCRQLGWHAVEPPPPASGADRLLPPLHEGQAVQVDRAELTDHLTQAPPRYSDATLLGAMEGAGAKLQDAALRRAMRDAGLGTPATRAQIIETLLLRTYVRRDGNALQPTAAGRALVAALPGSPLTQAELTAQWEAGLAEVARGALCRPQFMQRVEALTRQVVAQIVARPVAPGGRQSSPPRYLCPLCSRGTLLRGRRAWGCSRWQQGCGFTVEFSPFGLPLRDADLHELLKKGRCPAPGGAAQLLVLDLQQQPHLRLEKTA